MLCKPKAFLVYWKCERNKPLEKLKICPEGATMRIEMIEHDCAAEGCSDSQFCVACNAELDESFCAACQRSQTEAERASAHSEHLSESLGQAAPWAAEILPCEGGWMAFESSADAQVWENQT
jgi:hypothetical protein